MNKSAIGNFLFNSGLIGFYYRVFKKSRYVPYKNYKFSDEQLKFTHLLEAVNYCKVAKMPQVYFEFGCHSARTFSAVVGTALHMKMDQMKFYAFDSFQGLPTTDANEDGIFQTGTFNTPIEEFLTKVFKKTGYRLNKENVVKGYFSDSLTPELQEKMPQVGIVHIDVDLYSSTKDVFGFIRPLLTVGTVILFDDYYCFPPDGKKGEMRALLELLEEDKTFTVKEWKAYSTFGQSFFVTSC